MYMHGQGQSYASSNKNYKVALSPGSTQLFNIVHVQESTENLGGTWEQDYL